MNNKKHFSKILFLIALIIISCSSQEYTTAKLAIQQSDFEKAAEWLPKAMAVEPDNPEIPVLMAIEIHAKNEEYDEMISLFNKAMAIDSIKQIEIRSNYKPVKDHINEHTEFHWGNEYNKGVEQFVKLREDPDNKNIYYEKAISNFSNAITLKPFDARGYTSLATIYNDKGDTEAALSTISKSVEKAPESFESNYYAGQIYRSAGESPEKFIPYFEKATIIKPSHSKALRDLASAHYDLGNKEKSIQVFSDAIENENNDTTKADLYYNLGVIHNQMGNFKAAELSFDEAYFLNEEDFEAILGMARAYEGVGDSYFNGLEGFEKDFDEAAKWFRKAEKKIKSLMVLDIDNKESYKKNLDIVRYKKDVAQGDI